MQKSSYEIKKAKIFKQFDPQETFGEYYILADESDNTKIMAKNALRQIMKRQIPSKYRRRIQWRYFKAGEISHPISPPSMGWIYLPDRKGFDYAR